MGNQDGVASSQTRRDIHDLTLVLTGEEREVHFEQRQPGMTIGRRVRAKAIGYRSFVSDGMIYTDVLVETLGGSRAQMFVPLAETTFHAPTGPTEREDAKPDDPTLTTGWSMVRPFG